MKYGVIVSRKTRDYELIKAIIIFFASVDDADSVVYSGVHKDEAIRKAIDALEIECSSIMPIVKSEKVTDDILLPLYETIINLSDECIVFSNKKETGFRKKLEKMGRKVNMSIINIICDASDKELITTRRNNDE